MGPLHLVDHLIRVHPEQKLAASTRRPELQSQITPLSEYLRLFVTKNEDAARAIRERLLSGKSFYTLARESSVDSTAPIGGYLGRKNVSDLGSALAPTAARLHYGEISDVVQDGGRWIILQRLPRDFRFDAEEVEREGEDLEQRGDAAGAIGKAQQALMIYPQLLRALDLIGVTFAKSGNPKKGADVLHVAERLYPDDAGNEFMLASVLDSMGDKSGASVAYKRAITLDSDLVEAYANLGMISYGAGDWKAAIGTFRQGLQIDPMRAELYYDLSLALRRSGDVPGATRAIAIAGKLDPQLLSTDPDSAAQPNQPGSF
jgi:tetratricopeptide (TPR) repeat protein